MLTLPIKKKWFDMILSGEKKEEYREIKPYYISRFMNLCGIKGKSNTTKMLFRYLLPIYTTNQYAVRFRNGYSKNASSFVAKCTLSVGTGREEWGAEKGKEYFILTIHGIRKGGQKMCMMSEDETKKMRELIKTMPKEHPFEYAELCELYCYDDTPTYVTTPAWDAFTYPTYDRDSQNFNYRHYDMDAETSEDVRVALTELLEAHIDDGFVKAIEICNMFNVPMADIKTCQEEILKAGVENE